MNTHGRDMFDGQEDELTEQELSQRFDRKVRQVEELARTGVRHPMANEMGQVTVSPHKVVLFIELIEDNIRFSSESRVAANILDALRAAERAATDTVHDIVRRK